MPKTDFGEEPKLQFESTKFLFLTALLAEILQHNKEKVGVLSERLFPP